MRARLSARVGWLIGSVAIVAGLGAGLLSAAGTASAKPPTTTAGGIVNADGTTIAGTGFTVSHPAVGTYVVRYGKGSFPSNRHAVINVTPGTLTGVVVVPSIFAVSAVHGGLTATIVLSSTAGQITPANENFGFVILEV